MTRSEALEQFKEKFCSRTDELAEEFIKGLDAQVEELMGQILEAFGEIADQAEEKDTVCVFFQFSLLRYDLMQDTAKVRLDVMDGSWYLDQQPLYAELDLTFLFTPYFKWRKKLLTDMREYMGKVNRYDVENIVQDKVMEAVGMLIQILRILFRNIESQENFARIPKTLFWEIHFGEYRDYSEPIIQMNREPRSEEEWLEKLREHEENDGNLQFTWWHKAELSNGDCREKKMYYIVFEECSLTGIDFEKAKLMGARFLNCSLEGCSFKQADLTQAEFDGCSFKDCDFTDAGLQQALFSLAGLEADWFDEKQKDEMLIAEGAER